MTEYEIYDDQKNISIEMENDNFCRTLYKNILSYSKNSAANIHKNIIKL